MKAFHQFSTFQKIISEYKNDEPLSRFLGVFYRQNKQMGSRDRRNASRLVYNYYRLGNALNDIDLVEKLAVAEFLCNDESNSFLEYYLPDWNLKIEPVYRVLDDSKWMEIYQYDVYLGLNRPADAQRWMNKMMTTTDSYPRAGTQWFKNWFLPIYENYGKTKVLNGFFNLLKG